jgi:hypothetical protein
VVETDAAVHYSWDKWDVLSTSGLTEIIIAFVTEPKSLNDVNPFVFLMLRQWSVS